jgi:hypothetical protein
VEVDWRLLAVASLAFATALAHCSPFTTASTSDAGIEVEEEAGISDAQPVDGSNAELGCDAPGLVTHFRFDEGAGRALSDCTRTGLSATVPDGGSLGPGVRGGALVLGGAAPLSIGRPKILSLTGAFTVAAWVRADGLSDSERPTIVGKMGETRQRGWELALADVGIALPKYNRNVFFRVSPDGISEPHVASARSLPLGQWVHVAGVFSPGSRLEVFLDGTLEGQGTAPSVASDPEVDVVIGGRAYNYFWRGALDEVQIYERALTAAEIVVLAQR